MEASTRWQRALLGVFAGSLIAAPVLWPTAVKLAAVWTESEAYGYAWLVIPMLAYLLGWHYRQDILASHPRPDLRGAIVAAVAALCWTIAEAIKVDVGRQFALVLAIQGIVISAMGWRLYRQLLPIMALSFLMIPSGDLLLVPLRKLTVLAMDAFATVVKLPHRTDGFFVDIDGQGYEVLEACAGLSHAVLAFFLAYCVGLLFFRSWLKIAALALLGALLGILSNVIRVSAIVWIDWINGTQMPLTGHHQIQWVALAIVLALLFLIVTRLEPEPLRLESADPSPAPGSRHAPILAGLSVLLIAGSTGMLLRDEHDSPAAPTALRPQAVQGWEPVGSSGAWLSDPARELASATLGYQRDGRTLQVTLIEALSSKGKFQEAQLAPLQQEGWIEIGSERLASCVQSKCMSFVHVRWLNERRAQTRHVFYTYTVGEYRTDSKLALRLATGWQRLSRTGARPRLIGITVDGEIRTAELLPVLQAIVERGWSGAAN